MTDELKLAQHAAREAGRIILSYYRSEYRIGQKGFNNPVTTADLKADEKIKEILRHEYPEYGWLSEETRDSSERLTASRVWVVDPLDGTKEFIKGLPEFTVSIGLVEETQPVMGVIYNPVKDELYFAIKGGGAFCNSHKITCSQLHSLDKATLIFSRTEYKRGLWKRFQGTVAEIRPAGGMGHKLALIASGQGDLNVSLVDKSEWDICAGDIILQEAGGKLTDLSGKERAYNQKDTILHGGLIAGNQILVERMLAWINKS